MFNYTELVKKIFSIQPGGFENLAIDTFRLQYKHNRIYREYVDHLQIDPQKVDRLDKIPFLPVELFKTHEIIWDGFTPQLTFTSSGTTGAISSKHPVADVSIYEESFMRCFTEMYGDPAGWTFLCLLPSYLERAGSSLVYMAEKLAGAYGKESGFYLHNYQSLAEKLSVLEAAGQKILLLGVTYALLDLAEQFPMPLKDTVIMETGGMKGRRREKVREEVHDSLRKAFKVTNIHSEYGMTEMLSQAYSQGKGIYKCPPWLKVVAGDLYDPGEVKKTGRGRLHIIDLANLLSCSFLATQDIGEVFEDGTFTVLGRADNTDVRGCNLMVSSP